MTGSISTDKAVEQPAVKVDLAILRRELAHHLSQIHGAYFVPEVRLTLIARLPGNDDADLVVTADDTAEAIKALQRRGDHA
jgi:predicted RNA-binding protein with PUA domain